MTDQTDLADRIRSVLELDPAAPAIEFQGSWYSWGALGTIGRELEHHLSRSVAPGAPVGVVMRNDPAVVGAMLGVLLAGRCLVTVNPSRGDVGLSTDLAALQLPVLLGVERDWGRPEVKTSAAGALGLTASIDPAGVTTVEGLERLGTGAFRPAAPGVAIEMLTSGTTGPPKRVPLSYQAVSRALTAARDHYGKAEPARPRLSSGVAIVSSPLVHMSGTFRTLLNICEGRRIALMDRFRVNEFVYLLRRHRPRAVSLVPAALAMMLDAEVDVEALSSVEVVTSGTAHLPVQLQTDFEDRFSVAVLPSYGATEFAGGVAGWNLPLYRKWGAQKRGSVGRPQSGRDIRVVAGAGEPQPATGEQGLIEVRAADGEWIRTTDLGRIDADGFVFIDGRTDDAIVRGGFKIMPSDVVAALRSHPAVRDAGVTGLADARVGAVPVAAVELQPGAGATADELLSFAREQLSGYAVPAQLLIVDALPRTPSMKVSQPELRSLFKGGPDE